MIIKDASLMRFVFIIEDFRNEMIRNVEIKTMKNNRRQI